MKTGVVTGGHYQSNEGCYPYPIRPCRHGSVGIRPACGPEGGSTPYCSRSCQGGDVNDWANSKQYGYSGYRVGAGRNVAAIMKELYKRGPIQATFYIYSDFLNYRKGVYVQRTGEMLGGHAVKLIGWGVDDTTQLPYWLLANSWNTDWVSCCHLLFFNFFVPPFSFIFHSILEIEQCDESFHYLHFSSFFVIQLPVAIALSMTGPDLLIVRCLSSLFLFLVNFFFSFFSFIFLSRVIMDSLRFVVEQMKCRLKVSEREGERDE